MPFVLHCNIEELKFVQSAGDDLISITVANPREGQALAQRLRDMEFWLEVVAGIESVVVQFDNACVDREAAERAVDEALNGQSHDSAQLQHVIEIPVVYGGAGGPDFAAVCEQLGLSECELIELHTAQDYEVEMVGFTPGFAYVGGLGDALNVARLATPRVSVPAGSVGIADGRTGLYALQGPGGWPIIGCTDFKLFDASAEAYFALQPGRKVRFVVAQRT
jgi:allophanate hydrolase